MISIAHHERPIRPANPASLPDRIVARVLDYIFNRSILLGCRDGRIGLPLGLGQRIAGGGLDYVGVNYYCEELTAFDIGSPATLFARAAGTICSPDGKTPAPISQALQDLHQDLGLPLLITENGTNTTDDSARSRFIVETVLGVRDAIAHGVPVLGYMHWSAMDNFEWSSGYGPKFGLASVDRNPASPTFMNRIPKGSAQVFSTIARFNGVPAPLVQRLSGHRGGRSGPRPSGPLDRRTGHGLAA